MFVRMPDLVCRSRGAAARATTTRGNGVAEAERCSIWTKDDELVVQSSRGWETGTTTSAG